MSESNRPENKLVAERRKKLASLRANGFDFPNAFRRTALAGQLHRIYDEHSNDAFEAEPVEVLVAGRMMTQRVMGKASFATIQDRSGQIQLFVQRDQVGKEDYSGFKSWDLGECQGRRNAPADEVIAAATRKIPWAQ